MKEFARIPKENIRQDHLSMPRQPLLMLTVTSLTTDRPLQLPFWGCLCFFVATPLYSAAVLKMIMSQLLPVVLLLNQSLTSYQNVNFFQVTLSVSSGAFLNSLSVVEISICHKRLVNNKLVEILFIPTT